MIKTLSTSEDFGLFRARGAQSGCAPLPTFPSPPSSHAKPLTLTCHSKVTSILGSLYCASKTSCYKMYFDELRLPGGAGSPDFPTPFFHQFQQVPGLFCKFTHIFVCKNAYCLDFKKEEKIKIPHHQMGVNVTFEVCNFVIQSKFMFWTAPEGAKH